MSDDLKQLKHDCDAWDKAHRLPEPTRSAVRFEIGQNIRNNIVGKGGAIDHITALEVERDALLAEKRPRLTEAMIIAACEAHYGKGYNIDGVDLTADGVNWTFREGFTRMWKGAWSARQTLGVDNEK